MPGPGSPSVLTNLAVRRRQLKAGRQMLGFERSGAGVGQVRPQSAVRPDAPPNAPSPQPAEAPPSRVPEQPVAVQQQGQTRRPITKAPAQQEQKEGFKLPDDTRQRMLQQIQSWLTNMQAPKPQPVLGRARRFVGGGL